MDWGKIWIEQCEAARGIEDEFGTPEALEYLIGDKFINFLEAADDHVSFRAEIPAFVAEIKSIFERWHNWLLIWKSPNSQSHSIPVCLSQGRTRYLAKRKSNSTSRKLKR